MYRGTTYGPFPPPGEAPDPSGAYANPAGWQPFPAPTSVPSPGWFGPTTRLGWQGVPVGNTHQGVNYRFAVWHTPTFDLRPEFRGVTQSNSEPNRGELPIWRASGAGGQLYVLLHFGAGTLSLVDLNIVSYDEAHPTDPNSLRPITAEQDVTSAFTTGNQTGLGFNPPGSNRGMSGQGVFTPPGGGSPTRFWRMTLVFRFFIPHEDPIDSIAASYY